MEVYWATVKLANVGLSAQPPETPGRNTVNNVVMRSVFAEAGRDRVFFLWYVNLFTAQILRTAREDIRFCLAHQQHPATRLSQQTCNFCGMLWIFVHCRVAHTFRRGYQAKSYTIIHLM